VHAASGTAGRGLLAAQGLWAGLRYAGRFSLRRSDPPATEPPVPGWFEEYVDGHTTGPGIWKWRHYLPAYERHLAPFRNTPVRILEIGIFSGGSLAMWRSYFGPDTEVYGVDIEPACRSYEDAHTHVFIGDQADTGFWRSVLAEVGQIDIVIDDGGHQPLQQIRTLEAVLPHLGPGGVYMCEDVHGRSNVFTAYVDGLIRSLHESRWLYPEGSLHLQCDPTEFQRRVDSIHVYPYLVVIEMRRHPLDLLSAPKMGDQWQPFLGVAVPDQPAS